MINTKCFPQSFNNTECPYGIVFVLKPNKKRTFSHFLVQKSTFVRILFCIISTFSYFCNQVSPIVVDNASYGWVL